jgi:photosystem II PsbZ protein
MPYEFIRFTENPRLFIQHQFWEKARFSYVGKNKMSIVFQIALISLVLFSFVLVVGVPVAYATPQNWVESKKLLWVGSGIWAALVVLVGILNFFVA